MLTQQGSSRQRCMEVDTAPLQRHRWTWSPEGPIWIKGAQVHGKSNSCFSISSWYSSGITTQLQSLWSERSVFFPFCVFLIDVPFQLQINNNPASHCLWVKVNKYTCADMILCGFGAVTLHHFMSNANPRPEGEHLFLLCSCWVLSCHSLFNLPPCSQTVRATAATIPPTPALTVMTASGSSAEIAMLITSLNKRIYFCQANNADLHVSGSVLAGR